MNPTVWYIVSEVGTGRWLPRITRDKKSIRHRPCNNLPPRLFADPEDCRRTITQWQKMTTYDLVVTPVVMVELVDYNLMADEPLEAKPLRRPIAKYAHPPEWWQKYRKQRKENMRGTQNPLKKG